MRFVAGSYSAEGRLAAGPGALRPRNAVKVPFDGESLLWAVGFGVLDIRSGPAEGGDAEVVAIGCCLASDAELREARDSAERGRWAHAASLPGSYVAVVRNRHTVRVIGDRAATHVVYWIEHGQTVLWSTSALVLAAYADRQPSAARLLAGMTLFGVDHLADHSYFDGVHRVPPGQALVLDPNQPPTTEPVPRRYTRLTFHEGAEALSEHLTTAVHRRAASGHSLSADLSGGVDSSAVASIAAARSPLLAVTYTDNHMAEQDDLRYARQVAAQYGNITHARVNGSTEQVRHFDELDDPAALPVTDGPSLSLGLLAIKRAQLAPAVAHGSQLHLTGRGGDNVLDSLPISVIDLAHSGRRRTAAGRITAFVRARRAPLHSALLQAARTRRTPYPRALAVLAAEIRRQAPPPSSPYIQPAQLLASCGPLSSAGWLTGAGRRAVTHIIAHHAHTAAADTLPGEEHERIALERMGEEHATFDQIARQLWGLPIHAPYLDNQAVDACLAVPGWERWVPGDFKPLARQALAGSVPGFLLQRRTKTPMTGSLHQGLRANAETLRAVLTHSRLAEAGLINPAPALAALDSAARGELAPLGALHQLFVTERWLTTLPSSRHLWWEPAPQSMPGASR